jgi:hypothetical protein
MFIVPASEVASLYSAEPEGLVEAGGLSLLGS